MWLVRTRSVILTVLATAVGMSPVLAQGGPPPGGPPPPNGEQLYQENCSQCHGPEGDAVASVDLMHGRFRRGTTDAELAGIVLRGINGTDMPPHSFSEPQAAAIVTFLRIKADRSASTSGDASRGQAIFSGKGNCASCHRIGANGARLGPDLSEIGRLRHSAELERSMLDPDASIVPSNRFVRMVTRDGATITGRLLNHDTFSVQVLDSKEQLVSLPTSNLREFTFIDKSSMPTYRDKLSTQELADLVSYLVSLKGGGTQ
jgi:putative heme-binding domain-containing protein